MSFRLSVLLLVTSSFVSCFGPGKKNPDAAVWKTYTAKNYSIQYPQDWPLDTSRKKGEEFFLYAPVDLKTLLFRENFNLVIQSNVGGQSSSSDLDSYISLSEDQVNQQKASLLRSERMHDANGDYHILEYTAFMYGYDMKFRQRIKVIDGNAYVLTYTTTIKQAELYQKQADRIFDSFQVK